MCADGKPEEVEPSNADSEYGGDQLLVPDHPSGITIRSEVIQTREELDAHLAWMFDVGEPM